MPGSLVLAQDIAPANNDENEAKEISEFAVQVVPEGKVSMSLAENDASVYSTALSTADDLVRQTNNTAMVAGSCLVIDALVQQFCSANPNDISCQFQ